MRTRPRLSDLSSETTNGDAYGRLGAVDSLGGFREASFFHDSHEKLQLRELHRSVAAFVPRILTQQICFADKIGNKSQVEARIESVDSNLRSNTENQKPNSV